MKTFLEQLREQVNWAKTAQERRNARAIYRNHLQKQYETGGLVPPTPTDWHPPHPSSGRPDGYECLAWHRGKWTHVKWSAEHRRWHLGYGAEFITTGQRAFAPLPPKPQPDTFYDW